MHEEGTQPYRWQRCVIRDIGKRFTDGKSGTSTRVIPISLQPLDLLGKVSGYFQTLGNGEPPQL
jgi:hypothetical protein